MAPMIFAKNIFNKLPIDVFNFGRMKRDFTYIDDIVEAIFRCCYKPATPNKEFDYFNPDPATSFAPHRVFNIGNSKQVKLLDFIDILEKNIGMDAIKNLKDLEVGDVIETYSDSSKIEEWIGFAPQTDIEKGVEIFINWYRSYYS